MTTDHRGWASIVLHKPTHHMHQAGRSQMHQVVPGHVLVKPDVLQTSPAPWGSGEGLWEGAQMNQSAGYHMTLDMSKWQQSEPSTSLQLMAKVWDQWHQKWVSNPWWNKSLFRWSLLKSRDDMHRHAKVVGTGSPNHTACLQIKLDFHLFLSSNSLQCPVWLTVHYILTSD